jgi:hypothetical protein
MRDLERILRQSNISRRNVAWAESFATHEDEEIRTLATIVAEVGRVHPHRRRRHGRIRHQHPELWQRIVAAGLVHDWFEYDHAGSTPAAPPIDPDEPWPEPEDMHDYDGDGEGL